MDQFVKDLKKEMNLKIEVIERSEEHQIEKASKAFRVLGEAFDRLKEFIISYCFKDEAEEIEFFKEVKPKLFYQLIYYRKIYNIEMNRPIACLDAQKAYLICELEDINKYTAKRLDFIRYYRAGSTYLDRLYFLRGKTDTEQYLETFFYELDPDFSTNCDFKVAKILANDMLSAYLLNELEMLEGKDKKVCGLPFPETRLTWQANKSDLIELIYAFNTKECFGKIPLRQLANYFEQVFNITLDNNLSRAFSDMKIRNNPTPGIDGLKDALIKRMQLWKRNKRKKDDDEDKVIDK